MEEEKLKEMVSNYMKFLEIREKVGNDTLRRIILEEIEEDKSGQGKRNIKDIEP